jgi:hypothetical protein
MLIAVDDPAFPFFIGLCLLRGRRALLIMSDSDSIPEIIATLNIKDEAEIDALVLSALELYRSVPRCFLRAMRLCSVSNTEIAPKPFGRSVFLSSLVN